MQRRFDVGGQVGQDAGLLDGRRPNTLGAAVYWHPALGSAQLSLAVLQRFTELAVRGDSQSPGARSTDEQPRGARLVGPPWI